MHPRWCAAALACSALLALPSAAGASGGTYTHVLCADPETGAGVAADGAWPDGITAEARGTTHAGESEADTRCSGRQHAAGGLWIRPARHTLTMPGNGDGIVVRYRAPQGVEFRSAALYRYSTVRDFFAYSVNGADASYVSSGSNVEYCQAPGLGCHGHGVDGAPFSPANRLAFSRVGSVNGFNIAYQCVQNQPSGPRCEGQNWFRFQLFGGRIALEDDSDPAPAGAPSGGLATDAVLRDTETVSLAATDTGSGVYRVRLLIDGVSRSSLIADANQGRCRDVDPADDDDHEFAFRQPCRLSASGTYAFDTRGLPEGARSVRVVVEDAAGNDATVLDRDVTIDNVPAPSASSPPLVEGVARAGRTLEATPAEWDDHGAAGDPAVTRRWQRCHSTGADCADVAGAGGLAHGLGDGDVGRRLRIVEVATNGEGTTQVVSALTPIVARADGTLPADGNGIDDDGDGQVDEGGEQAPGSGTGSGSGSGGPGGSGGTATSGAGAAAAPGGGTSSSSTSTTTRSTTSTSSSSSVVVNGEGGSARARLTVAFRDAPRSRRFAVPFGRSAVVTGRLVDEAGRPIRGADVEVSELVRVRGARAASAPPVRTGADGTFRYEVTRRASNRRIVFAYRHVRGGDVASQDDLDLDVRPGVRLRVSLAGGVVRYRGQVLAGAIPRGGKVVVVQGRVAGGRWQTFATRRARGTAGRFRGRYRLNVRRPGQRLQFRARVVAESGWPYLPATSRAVTRRVR